MPVPAARVDHFTIPRIRRNHARRLRGTSKCRGMISQVTQDAYARPSKEATTARELQTRIQDAPDPQGHPMA